MFDRNGESDVQPFNQKTAMQTVDVSERKATKLVLSFPYVARKQLSELTRRNELYPDILTPRFPARRPLGPARLILRSQWIQVWLKDESLEDSAF